MTPDQLTQLLRRDWAVRVLDAWTFQRRCTHGWQMYEASNATVYCRLWTATDTFDYEDLKDPHEARMGAAIAVWPQLPDDVKARIGECPE